MPSDASRARSELTAGERRASPEASPSGAASAPHLRSPFGSVVRGPPSGDGGVLRIRARVWGARASAKQRGLGRPRFSQAARVGAPALWMRNATESAAVGAGVDVCASTTGARRACGTRRACSTRRASRTAAASVAGATCSASRTAARAARSALSTAIQGGRRRTRSAGERRCFRPFVDTSGHAQEPARGEKHTPSIHCGHSFHLSHPKVFGEAVGETRAA